MIQIYNSRNKSAYECTAPHSFPLFHSLFWRFSIADAMFPLLVFPSVHNHLSLSQALSLCYSFYLVHVHFQFVCCVFVCIDILSVQLTRRVTNILLSKREQQHTERFDESTKPFTNNNNKRKNIHEVFRYMMTARASYFLFTSSVLAEADIYQYNILVRWCYCLRLYSLRIVQYSGDFFFVRSTHTEHTHFNRVQYIHTSI